MRNGYPTAEIILTDVQEVVKEKFGGLNIRLQGLETPILGRIDQAI